MKKAPAKHNFSSRYKQFLLNAVVVAGAILGAVWFTQYRPNPEYFPLMSATPFIGAQGNEVFVQRREVTIVEWNRCHTDGACTLKLRAPVLNNGGDYPATGISWVDANEYLTWINSKSRLNFRLPTAQEWNAMAAPVMPEKPDPIFTDPALSWASAYLLKGQRSRKLEPSESYSQTSEGIYDLDGNVWEWTQDCYEGAVEGAKMDVKQCPAFIVGGEHEAVISFLIRDPARGGCAVGTPPPHLGMRLVSDKAVPSS